jgi:DNA-directed RNA polymerase specialized sigma24 family protein
LIRIAKDAPQPDTFEDFYNMWYPHIYRFFSSRGYVSPVIDDLLQDTMLHIWKRWEIYDPTKGEFTSYVWTHVQYCLSDLNRSLAKRFQFEVTNKIREISIKSAYAPFPIQDKQVDDASFTGQVECDLAVEQTLDSLQRSGVSWAGPLFRSMIESARIGAVNSRGKIHAATLGRRMGISKKTTSVRLKKLVTMKPMQDLYEAVKGV